MQENVQEFLDQDAPQAEDLEDYVEATEEKPKKKGFFGGLFGGRK